MSKKKQATPPAPCLGEERIRPDGRVLRFVEEEHEDFGTVRHFRTVDTLGLMLKHGSITPAMHDAGQQFSQDFARAFASGVSSNRFDGLPAGTALTENMIERNAAAARAVRDALDAVGGMGSPAGSALWFVAGLGLSVREWATRQGWSGRPISLHEAKGMLVAALGMLARHYGYERGPRSQRSTLAPHSLSGHYPHANMVAMHQDRGCHEHIAPAENRADRCPRQPPGQATAARGGALVPQERQ